MRDSSKADSTYCLRDPIFPSVSLLSNDRALPSAAAVTCRDVFGNISLFCLPHKRLTLAHLASTSSTKDADQASGDLPDELSCCEKTPRTSVLNGSKVPNDASITANRPCRSLSR